MWANDYPGIVLEIKVKFMDGNYKVTNLSTCQAKVTGILHHLTTYYTLHGL
jgi:hypothetical protein